MIKVDLDGSQRIVILQSEKHAAHYEKYQKKKSDFIVPIGAEAMHYADKKNWTGYNIGDFFLNDDYSAAAVESQLQIDSLIEELNEYSRKFDPTLGLEIGNYYAFQLWIIIGQIHYNRFICVSIARYITTNIILIYTKNKSKLFMELRPDPDCIFSEVIVKSGLFDSNQIKLIQLSNESSSGSLKLRLMKLLPLKVFLRIREFRDSVKVLNLKKVPYKLLLIGGGYDWLKICHHEEFRNLFNLKISSRPIAKRSESNTSKELVELLNNAVKNSYDITNLASVIYSDLLYFVKNSDKIKERLKKYDSIITSGITYPWDNFVAHTAAKRGMSVIVWQHGEKGQAVDITIPYTELFYATDYFAYAPEVRKLYKKWIGKNRLKEVQFVGSVGKNITQTASFTIVYATGKWFKTATPFPPLIDPDRRLLDAHKVILNYLDKISMNKKVIFKANNTPGFSAVPYEYKNIKFDYSTPFSELLKTAGIIVLDTPATTLIEACSTSVPIFVLGGRLNYFPDFLELIKRRVVWCQTPNELVDKLNLYITSGIYDADIYDESYLRSYGTHLSMNEVTHRVSRGLLSAIARQKSESK